MNGYSSPGCEGNEYANNSTSAGAVLRSATVRVHPEGIVRSDSESAYFCANGKIKFYIKNSFIEKYFWITLSENMIVSTTDNYKYEWIAAPRNRESVVLEIKTGGAKRLGAVHVALAENRSPSDRMYKITIGDTDNSVTWLSRGKHGKIFNVP